MCALVDLLHFMAYSSIIVHPKKWTVIKLGQNEQFHHQSALIKRGHIIFQEKKNLPPALI